MAAWYGDSSGDLDELQKLLQGLNILGQDLSHSGDTGKGDPGASALESVATTLTKGVAAAVAALGGTSAVTAFISKSWGASKDVQVPLVYGASIVAAACALALAIIVASDLRSRARGQSSMYAARSAIAVEFMRLFPPSAVSGNACKSPVSSAAAAETAQAGFTALQVALVAVAATRQQGVRVTVSGDAPGSGDLSGIREHNDTVELHVRSGDGVTDGWFALSTVHLEAFPPPVPASA